MSPQGEWVDLDIDLAKPHHEDGWTWNSGFVVAARIDSAAKIWYGAMRFYSPPCEGALSICFAAKDRRRIGPP